MIVLALPHPGCGLGLCFEKAGDVDEEPVANIDPARVDHVVAIAVTAVHDCGVDVQKVLAEDGRGVGGGICVIVVEGVVIEDCAVEMGGEGGEGGAGDLRVDV